MAFSEIGLFLFPARHQPPDLLQVDQRGPTPLRRHGASASATALAGLGAVGIHKLVRMWFRLWMDRDVLTDAQWAQIEPHCLGKPTDAERSGRNNRLFMEAVLWIARTDSPWRDLPERFGNWSTAFRRFRDWRAADVFKRIVDALSDEPDLEYAMVDATIVRSTGTAKAQRGDSEPGYRSLQWRHDDQDLGAHRRARV